MHVDDVAGNLSQCQAPPAARGSRGLLRGTLGGGTAWPFGNPPTRGLYTSSSQLHVSTICELYFTLVHLSAHVKYLCGIELFLLCFQQGTRHRVS